MQIEDHIKRVQGYERALSRLDPAADMQLFVWFLEKAGAHCMNAALHRWKITPEIPDGAGAVREPDENAEWEDAAFYKNMAKAGDYIHTRYKPAGVALTPDAEVLFENLFFIEEERADYVRGIEPLSPAMLEKFKTAYRTVRAFAPIPGEAPL
ncbi:MAG: hypothetical protein RIB59_09895 [Rhodospirillales bacterium]